MLLKPQFLRHARRLRKALKQKAQILPKRKPSSAHSLEPRGSAGALLGAASLLRFLRPACSSEFSAPPPRCAPCSGHAPA
eukprot:UN07237